MKVLDVRLLRSAASPADFPRDPVSQVAMVGRSNVGKSTLINALTKRRVARTSAAPGKTRLLNVYFVELSGFEPERLYLVDLPGYGYARGGATSASSFDALVSTYFAHPAWDAPGEKGRPTGPSMAVQVVDARHPGLAPDIAAYGWLLEQGRPVVVVASKVDKLSQRERAASLRDWTKALNVPILPMSAETGEGLDRLWTQISRLLRPSK